MLPPAIVIHGLAHARAALAPGRPVTLLSAPGAALYAGAGWWRALIDRAIAEVGREVPDVLDCGEAPGRALEALALGCGRLVLAPVAAFASVAQRASLSGAVLLTVRPEALDLAPFDLRKPGAARRVEAWLGTG